MTLPEATLGGLAAIELDAADGGRVRLGDLWEEEHAIVVWLRHYG